MKNSFRNVTDSSFTKLPPELRNCHYHGHVVNGSRTKVAVGVCNGLHGFIHTDNEQYFIEPLKDETFGPDGQHKHVVYKRSALAPELDPLRAAHLHKRSAEDASCGVKEFTKADRRRKRWESHQRHKRKSPEHHRQKRSFSTERYVETLVVVDPSMVKYHKNEHLETYVLTIMNMVAAMFHDASIGNSINIILVRVLLIEKDQDDLAITHHADRTLTSFCKFQKKINFKDDDNPNHHDVAVLLTRKNICSRLDEPCSTLGLAQVSGMCQPHWSCNINEDTGLALAYTVTHEIGHNFGMHHDGYRNGCEEPPGKQMYLMSPSLVADSLTKVWSTCSRDAITKFIDRDWGYCLNDEPGDHDFPFPVLPPGTMYDANHQCRLQYGGDNVTICTDEQDVCSNLWCKTEKGCSTHLEAAAEGTICGKNKEKWCYQGKCVKIGDRPEMINGEWGQWTSWSDCTRSCGGGVSHSQRHCDNPQPSHGGKYCLGERKRYRICNTEDCPDDGKSFNQAQCEEFNYIPYKGHYYEWEHVLAPDSPCQLHCKPKNRFFSSLLKDIVTDGTPCTPGTPNMCISGRCRHIGCDYMIDSKAKEDRCGVCHGDGSTCKTVKDQFKESKGLGYVEATVIPRGARNIWVEEMAEANNFLALQNDRGEYYLNGHWFIQWSGDYEIAGTVIHYKRIGNKESFKAPGPLKEPLHIMLLLQSENPGVSFEYTVPKENISEPRTPEFNWVYMPWTHCTASCGGGTQRAEVVCTEIEAGVVDDKYCGTGKPDDKQKVCNDYLCPARWWTGPWQHCSVTCGKDGTHQRTVICVRSMGLDEQIALDDEACDPKKKPPEIEPCHKKEPCPGNSSWITGEWSKCDDNLCGVKFRSVTCENPTIGCDESAIPLSEMPCSNITCGQWVAENWSQCPVTCGMGEQKRQIHCEGGEQCNIEDKPSETKLCIFEPCPIITELPTTSTSTQKSITIASTISSSTPSSTKNIIDHQTVTTSTTKSSVYNSEQENPKTTRPSALIDNSDKSLDEVISVTESSTKPVDKTESTIEIESFDDVEENPKFNNSVFNKDSVLLSGIVGASNNDEIHKVDDELEVYEPENDKVFDKQSDNINSVEVDESTKISEKKVNKESSTDHKHIVDSVSTSNLVTSTMSTVNQKENIKEHVHKHRHHHELSTKLDDRNQKSDNIDISKEIDISEISKDDQGSNQNVINKDHEKGEKNYEITEEKYDEKEHLETDEIISRKKDLNSFPKLNTLPELPDLKSLPKLPNKEELAPLPDLKDLPPLPNLEDLPKKDLLPPFVENEKMENNHQIEEENENESDHNKTSDLSLQGKEKNLNKENNEEKIDNKNEEMTSDINTANSGDSTTDKTQKHLESVPAQPPRNVEVPKLPDISDLPPLPELSDLEPIPVNPDLGKFDLNDLPKLNSLPELPDLNTLPKLPNKEELAPLPDLKDLPPLPNLEDLPNKDLLPPVMDKSINSETLKNEKLEDKEAATKGIPLTGPPLEIKLPDITSKGETLPQKNGSNIPANIKMKPVAKTSSEIINSVSDNQDINSDVAHSTDINVEKPDIGKDPDVHSVLEEPMKMKSKDEIIENKPLMKWSPSKWTECSRACGDGVKTRTVVCVDERDEEVEDIFCDINTKPTAIEDCFIQPCLEWRLSQWSECSATCGWSVRQRNVVCPAEGACNPRQKPDTEEKCIRPDCVKWMSGQWSRCSKKCDSGEQVRLVQCVNLTSQLSSPKCEYSKKPSEKQICNTHPCKDNNAALTIKCEHNKMRSVVCRALKQMGQCHRRFVSLKCCKTCKKDKIRKLNKERPRSRASR